MKDVEQIFEDVSKEFIRVKKGGSAGKLVLNMAKLIAVLATNNKNQDIEINRLKAELEKCNNER